jgi:hypothetical protein
VIGLRIHNSQTTVHNSFRLAFLIAALALAPACVSRRAPVFAPAAREDAERAISAWREAVARADVGPAKLLYEARVSQGPFRMSGTLAVRDGPRSIEATLAGPFGDPVARLTDGALRGKGIKPIAVHEEELRWLLSGAWKGDEAPVVAGMDHGDALLRWTGGAEQVEAVLDVSRARFRSLQVRRREGAIAARYPDETGGRPRRIDLEDLGSGNALHLTLLAAEPAE